jgi:tRNA(Ile)-lysidine synthase
MIDDPFVTSVERRVCRWVASGLGTRWVVAVSGGSDSVGLLRVLHAIGEKAGLSLSVAHLDHGARGEASRADAAFVEELARHLSLPFDLGHWQPTRPGHFEADARAARLAWLRETATNRDAAVVAVGHTRDDQAETILHRIIRGTGIHGLAGIPARRTLGDNVTLVRPLLSSSRDEIRRYLNNIHQPFREDATNLDLDRTRARLRHDLLPKLAAEYNPKAGDALVRLGRQAAGLSRLYRIRVEQMEQITLALGSDGNRRSFVRKRLVMLPPFLRADVIRSAWRRAGWPEGGMSEARWRRLARRARSSRPGQWDVGGGIVASTDGNLFSLRRAAGSPQTEPFLAPEPLPLSIPGAVPWLDGRLIVTLDVDAPRDETIDLDRVRPPLQVRASRRGDRFAPLGMDGHETTLKNFFRGRRVPRDARARVPMLCDEVGIIWVVGHRIADRVRLTDKTERRAGLKWEMG